MSNKYYYADVTKSHEIVSEATESYVQLLENLSQTFSNAAMNVRNGKSHGISSYTPYDTPIWSTYRLPTEFLEVFDNIEDTIKAYGKDDNTHFAEPKTVQVIRDIYPEIMRRLVGSCGDPALIPGDKVRWNIVQDVENIHRLTSSPYTKGTYFKGIVVDTVYNNVVIKNVTICSPDRACDKDYSDVEIVNISLLSKIH